MSPEEKIRAILDDALGAIVTAMESQGVNASGRTSASFSVRESKGGGAQLVYGGGGAPLEVLEVGRPPGAVPYGFAEIIRQWARDKGIQFEDEKAERRFAGAVAYGKIARVGYGRPSPSEYGSRSESIYTPAVEDVILRIKTEMPAFMRDYIKDYLFR